MTVTSGLCKHRQRIAITHKHKQKEERRSDNINERSLHAKYVLERVFYYSNNIVELKIKPLLL